ncbi:hypothetical protein EDC01DRAFT_676103 [Geopyxis carbonaria]|nr:hypothetical protein EDC01DRAFT_676103 [Geopyxis carbonaria]
MSFYPPASPSRPSSYHSAQTSRHAYTHSPSSSRHDIHAHPQQKPFLTPVFSTAPIYDPKRISKESANPPPPKPQPSAPYVHLDFHTNLSDARQAPDDAVCPVSPRTITSVRFTTLFLRVLQICGTMGLLVLLLFLRRVEEMAGWIMRIPPAVGIVHTVYAAYHLSGTHRLKTPASSKAYFLFSSTVDLAILSFYAFTGVLSYQQWDRPAMQWTTIFADRELDRTLVLAIFILVCALGGLTLVSLLSGLYLLRSFRTLALLPPDMNPFALSERAQKTAAEKQKRWSASTASTAVGAESTAFLPGTERKMNFLDSRPETPQTQTRPYTPATPAEGRYRDSYPPIDVSHERHNSLHPELDLADSFSYRAGDDAVSAVSAVSEPDSTHGVQLYDSPAPRAAQLKRGSVASSISSFESISRSQRTFGAPEKRAPGTPDSPVRVDGSPGRVTKSWGAAGAGAQGFSKSSLLVAKNGEGADGARFRKISAEAH